MNVFSKLRQQQAAAAPAPRPRPATPRFDARMASKRPAAPAGLQGAASGARPSGKQIAAPQPQQTATPGRKSQAMADGGSVNKYHKTRCMEGGGLVGQDRAIGPSESAGDGKSFWDVMKGSRESYSPPKREEPKVDTTPEPQPEAPKVASNAEVESFLPNDEADFDKSAPKLEAPKKAAVKRAAPKKAAAAPAPSKAPAKASTPDYSVQADAPDVKGRKKEEEDAKASTMAAYKPRRANDANFGSKPEPDRATSERQKREDVEKVVDRVNPFNKKAGGAPTTDADSRQRGLQRIAEDLKNPPPKKASMFAKDKAADKVAENRVRSTRHFADGGCIGGGAKKNYGKK